MQENTAADLVTLGAENRKNQVAGAPPVADEYERLLARGLGIDSTPASPLERASVASAIRIVRQYLEEHPGFRSVSATDTVGRRMTLGGQPRIDLLWFGNGNTRGDLVVHLPDRGVVATGDLVVAPVPLAFGSHPASWSGVLDSVIAIQPRVVVTGHGQAMRDLGVRAWGAAPALAALASAASPHPQDLVLGRMLGQLVAVLSRVGAREDWATLTR